MNDSLLIYIRKNVPINGSITANKAKAIGYLYFLTNLLPLLLFFNSVSYKDLIKRRDLDAFKKVSRFKKNKEYQRICPSLVLSFQLVKLIHQ